MWLAPRRNCPWSYLQQSASPHDLTFMGTCKQECSSSYFTDFDSACLEHVTLEGDVLMFQTVPWLECQRFSIHKNSPLMGQSARCITPSCLSGAAQWPEHMAPHEKEFLPLASSSYHFCFSWKSNTCSEARKKDNSADLTKQVMVTHSFSLHVFKTYMALFFLRIGQDHQPVPSNAALFSYIHTVYIRYFFSLSFLHWVPFSDKMMRWAWTMLLLHDAANNKIPPPQHESKWLCDQAISWRNLKWHAVHSHVSFTWKACWPDCSVFCVGATLYRKLKPYLMTEEQLQEHGYPRASPEAAGRAVIHNLPEKKIITDREQLCFPALHISNS